MIKKFMLVTACMACSIGINAQRTMTAPDGGKAISDELIGIFFEDISHAADGGLYAELLQNGSFEYSPVERDGWGAGTSWKLLRPGHSLGWLETRMDNSIHKNNPTYMRLHTERVGHYYDFDGWTGFGLQNDGFGGIAVKASKGYDFSCFVRKVEGNEPCQLRVALVEAQGWGKSPKLLADTVLSFDSNTWAKVAAQLTPAEDCDHASLQLLSLTTGSIDIDMVSLMPNDTYKGHGLRRDLAEALEALHPKFMRFPGGCVVHGGGDGFWNTYRWKTTVGPREQRRQLKNTWGYHQSMGLGYFEYFQLCEDMGMQPLPILPCGVSCQGTNGGWSMRNQAQDVVPMSEMDEWVQDALDLIEWANGDPAKSEWARLRAEAGHPAPFGLKYLGIGNEEKITPEFEERFKYMYNKITAAHPEIVIVGTAGPGSHPGNPDFDNGWRIAEEIGLPILDEHYYEPNNYFLTSRQYDKYPRDRKTKVYLGEYASKDSKLIDALAEALYLLHVERNGDVVAMTSYAPLFARIGSTNWNPDLIYYDNTNVFLTCSYFVQQMFGQSSGNYYYGDCVKIADESNLQGQSVILNTKTRQLFVKVCNASDKATTAEIDLSRFKGLNRKATKTTIAGNAEDKNDNEHQPIAPVVESIKASKRMTMQLAPYSFVMLQISLK